MSVIQIYYAWVLRQFSELNELFLPKEVIVFITSSCKPKFRFIEDRSSSTKIDITSHLIYCAWILRQFSESNKLFLSTEIIIFIINLCKPTIIERSLCIKMKKRLDISQNLISGYFKSKPRFCYRRILPETDTFSTNLHNDSTLQKFFLQNNIIGIKDYIKTYNMIMILTKCNRVVTCQIKHIYNFYYSDSGNKSNSQYDFMILEDSIQILNFPFEINKIFERGKFIVLRSTSGIFYYFAFNYFGDDYFENHKALTEIPIRNIKKMIFSSIICIILTNDGYVWINNGNVPNNFKQIRITNVVKIYFGHSDTDIMFLTTHGDIYSYRIGCQLNIVEPMKINLSRVICVNVNRLYYIALTCNYDVYMWGNIKKGMRLIQDDLRIYPNIPPNSNTPILIDRIIFDNLSSTSKYIFY